EVRGLEDFRVRLEINNRSMTPEGADLLQFAGGAAALERLLPLEAVAANGGDEFFRQSVNHRGTDAVQTAGVNVIVPVAEFGARVEGGEDELEGGPLVLGMEIDGDAAAVVLHGDGVAVLVQRQRDGIGVAVEVFIDGVIDDFPDEVVQALAINAANVHR